MNPVQAVVVTVTGIDPPRATLRLEPLSVIPKLARTVRLRLCVLTTPPPDAVTVSVNVPGAAVEPAVSVNVLLPAPGEGMPVGANAAVTPAGTPLMERSTPALNPFNLAVVSAMGIDPPGAMLAPVPLADKVKLGGSVTVRLRL